MLSRRQIRLFIRLGVLGMLTLKSGLFTCALKAGQILAPIAAKFPEVEQAVKAETHIKDLVNRLLSETNLLRQYSDADRMLQMEEFHLPTFLYVKTMLQRHRGKSTKPLFIGISAPQGCGKTTLTSILVELFRIEGIKCVAMSLDDFYLLGQKQDQLANTFLHNKLLEFRGNAGTHDLHLAMTTFHSLMNMRRGGGYGVQSVQIPRYDKSLRQGRGDRAEKEQWQTIDEPVDVVLLEGWMLGFNPLPHIPLPVDPRSLLVRLSNTTTATTAETDTTAAVVTQRGEMAAEVSLVERQQQQQHKQQQQQLQESDRKPQDHQPVEQPTVSEEEVEAFEVAHNKARSLQEINKLLRPYEALNLFMDAWLVLAVQDVQQVYQWRLQAERQMRGEGKPGLTDEQVTDFVSRFMPAYDTYLPGLYKDGPQRGMARPELLVPAGSSANSEGGGQSALSPVLKVTVGNDRLPVSVELM